MSSTFIRRVFQEEIAELEARAQQRESEAQQREANLLERTQSIVADTVTVRFPEMPVRLFMKVREVTNLDALQDLNRALLRAADQAEAERILAQLGEQAAR